MEEFSKILNIYKNTLFKMIYSYVKDENDAQDILQEVFLKLYLNFHKIKDISKLKIYIYKITRNKINDFFRKKKREKLLLKKVEQKHSEESTPECTSTQILETLQKIPPKFKEIIILKDIQGLSYKEISKILNIRIGTVQSRLFRGRLILRRYLNET